MRKFILVFPGLLLALALGLFFGYPPYVESRLVAEIDRYNEEYPDRTLVVSDLTADPWTSTVSASQISVQTPELTAGMSDVIMQVESFLLFTPVRIVNSFTTGNFSGKDSGTGAEIASDRFEMNGVDISGQQAITGVLETVIFADALSSAEFKSMVMEGGTVTDASDGTATFERLTMTGLNDGILGEFTIVGLDFADAEQEVRFTKLAIYDIDTADLDGFGVDPDLIWVPSASDNPRSQILEFGEFLLEGAVVVPANGKVDAVSVDRLSVKALSYAPDASVAVDAASILESLNVDLVEAEGISVTGTEKNTGTIGTYSLSGLSGGIMGRMAIGGTSFVSDKGKATIGSFVIDTINLGAIAKLDKRRKLGKTDRPKVMDVFNAFVFGGFDMEDVSFDSADGSITKFGNLSLRELEYFQGIPVGATLTVSDNYQFLPKDMIETELSKLMGPVVIDLPTESLSSGELRYDLDMESGVMALTSQSADSVHGMRSEFDLRLSGLKDFITAAAEESPELGRHAAQIALEKIAFEIDSGTKWPSPERADGALTVRKFLIQKLAQLPSNAPEQQEMIFGPIRGFLERGGRVRLAIEPPQPIPVVQMQILPMLPPEQAIKVIGLTVLHE